MRPACLCQFCRQQAYLQPGLLNLNPLRLNEVVLDAKSVRSYMKIHVKFSFDFYSSFPFLSFLLLLFLFFFPFSFFQLYFPFQKIHTIKRRSYFSGFFTIFKKKSGLQIMFRNHKTMFENR